MPTQLASRSVGVFSSFSSTLADFYPDVTFRQIGIMHDVEVTDEDYNNAETLSAVKAIKVMNVTMDGFEVVLLEDVVESADIFITTTGNKDVIRIEHMRNMKDMAIVGNIGHFDNEIQVANLKNHKWTNIKEQVDMIEMPSGSRLILLSEGRLLNLGNATGHPSFVMSASFTNQVLAQIELWTKGDDYENDVYILPKHLDEKVARLHLDRIGVKLSSLSKDQAAYIGVGADGPFKPEHYRY